jgi:NADH:ubiquinone reductase (H+-translocating)
MTFVVIGAGPTGVEMAGQIAELSHRALGHNFRSIDPRRARVLLLDGGQQLLASFPQALQRRTGKDLERLGVEIHLGVRVTGVDVSHTAGAFSNLVAGVSSSTPDLDWKASAYQSTR